MAFAQGTSVPIDRSKAEIEATLARYGADQFVYGAGGPGAFVMFRAHGRVIRFVVPLPDRNAFLSTAAGRVRSDTAVLEAFNAEARRRWRALLLCIKAKLETVASGIASFENEFMPYTLLRNGRTVAEALGPEIERALAGDTMPRVAGLLEGPQE